MEQKLNELEQIHIAKSRELSAAITNGSINGARIAEMVGEVKNIEAAIALVSDCLKAYREAIGG